MQLFLHLIISLILAWNISAAIPAVLQPRFRSPLAGALKTLLLYVICLFPIIPDFLMTFIASFVVFIIYIFIFCRDRKEKTAAFSVIFFSIIGSWSYLSAWWIQRLSTMKLPAGLSVLVAVLLVILAVLYFSIFRAYFKQVAESDLLGFFTNRMWYYATVVALAPSALVMSLVSSRGGNTFIQQLLAFFSIAASTVIFPLLYQMGRSARLSEENARLRTQSEYYHGIEAQQLEIRKLKHDLMNHLTVIATYLDLGEKDKAVDYLKEIGTKFSELTKQYTSSPLINAILNSKRQKAAAEGIELTVKADVQGDISADSMDLCTLIANSLDNAIEANPPDRKIALELLSDGEMLFFSVSNRYGGEVKGSSDGTFISSKEDRKNHGFGIRNIKEAVARMGGKTEITASGSVFRVYAEVPMKKIR